MLAYYKTPYKKVLEFIDNKPKEDLDFYYDKYGIPYQDEFDMNEQLAEVISDDDIMNLGFDIDSEDDSTINDYSNYMDIDDVIKILNNTDEDILQDLMSHYLCNNLIDLAIVLTDSEIEYLKNINNVAKNDILAEDLPKVGFYDITKKGYNSTLDYLEDIPYDIQYYVLDGSNPNENVLAVTDDVSYYRFRENLDPILIDDCDLIDIVDNLVCFRIVPHSYEIDEDVIIRDKLNPSIFDKNHTMLPEVKEQILNYVENAINYLESQNITLPITDFVLIGSNAGYLYRDDSDIDIHILTQQPLQQNTAEHIFDYLKIYETENPLYIDDSVVELNVDSLEDLVSRNKDIRLYSIMSDSWLYDSDKNDLFTDVDKNRVDGYEGIVAFLVIS